MDPAIAFRVQQPEEPALEVRVNFGVYAGRNATAAEIDDLARSLRSEVSRFSVTAEARHEFGDDVETSLHQVVVAVGGAAVPEDVSERILATVERWATDCIASRSELGELRD
ncbi:MAG TPA: hypothetical protein VGN27_10805 [Gaiellaceae bacterium]|jgi:hypothetical protein|nr:hypothetical protein [Gaiellaceae bacterium]